MPARHKDKTLATFLAFAFGGVGAPRFYLYGPGDFGGWLHFSSLPASVAMHFACSHQPALYVAGPLILSFLAGFLEALTTGLTPDDKWDAMHNASSLRRSESRWPLALLLVLALAIGSTSLIASIARLADLLLTGGAYG